MTDQDEPDLPFFQSIPWCATLLADNSFTTTPTLARQYKASTEDALWAETLNTPSTIPACISQHKCLSPSISNITTVRMFISLGPGLNGHAGVCHGGVVSAILDDVMGFLLVLNRNLKGSAIEGRSTSTAYLNVQFKKPVATPQVILATATLKEIQGRKCLVEASIIDAQGVVLTTSDALWIGGRNGEELKSML